MVWLLQLLNLHKYDKSVTRKAPANTHSISVLPCYLNYVTCTHFVKNLPLSMQMSLIAK